jgi:hypothetical protein
MPPVLRTFLEWISIMNTLTSLLYQTEIRKSSRKLEVEYSLWGTGDKKGAQVLQGQGHPAIKSLQLSLGGMEDTIKPSNEYFLPL